MWWKKKGESNKTVTITLISASDTSTLRAPSTLTSLQTALEHSACSWCLERPVPDHHVDVNSMKTADYIAYHRDQWMKRNGTSCLLTLNGTSNMHLLIVHRIHNILRDHREEMIHTHVFLGRLLHICFGLSYLSRAS